MLTRARSLGAVALLLAAALPVACSTDLFKSSSSGATRSGLLPAGTRVAIEYERRHDPLVPADQAKFTAEVYGTALRGATLLQPDGTVFPFARADDPAAPGPRYTVEAESSEAAILARFPNGAYTIELTLEDGTSRTVTIFVRGTFPAYPEMSSPADGAAAVARDVRFEWAGAADRFDLTLTDDATGGSTVVLDGTARLTALLPAPLDPARSYVAELSAEDGPPGELVEFESTTVVRFRTAD